MRSYRKGTGSWRGTQSRLKVCRLSSMALGPRRQKRDEARSTVTVYGSLTPFPIKVFHSRFFSACSFGWWSPGRLRVANLSVVAMFYVNFWNFLHHRFWLSCLRTKQTPWSAIRSLCGYGAWITKFDFFFCHTLTSVPQILTVGLCSNYSKRNRRIRSRGGDSKPKYCELRNGRQT